jgi:hypothetical protein
LKKAETFERAKAEEYISKGNKAMQKKGWQPPVDLYIEPMKIDFNNAIYRFNRSAALLSVERHEESRYDADMATQPDPKYEAGLCLGSGPAADASVFAILAYMQLNGDRVSEKVMRIVVSSLRPTTKS